MADVFRLVTDRIIEELQKGVVPWHKPWNCLTGGAYNYVSKHRYSTLNQMLLKHDGPYASLQQWNNMGGMVRKGEKSEFVTFWKMPEKPDENSEDSADVSIEKKMPILRYYRVFHISQVDGIDIPKEFHSDRIVSFDKQAEKVFHNYLELEGVQFEETLSDEAFYSPGKDLIHLPMAYQFNDIAEYYGTVFHETIHSTGHANRLNRAGLQKVAFGSENYSKEELIAEIGSACMIRTLGLETEESISNNVAYVYGWLQALKADRWMIASAARQAEKAVRYILDCSKFDWLNDNSASMTETVNMDAV